MPAVSVVIPVHNGAAFIGRAIRSVQTQTLADWELIVVDDGSTDDTAQIVAGFADPRVRYLRQSNQGPNAARNRGLALAGGACVAFLDADDWWLPGKLSAQMRRLAEWPGAGLVYSSAQIYSEEGRLIGCEWARVEGRALETLLFGNWVTGSASSVLIPREVFAAVGGFNETLRHLEDWEMWLRIAAAYPLAAVPAPLVAITRRSESNSRQAAEMNAGVLRALQIAFETYAAHCVSLRQRAFASAHVLAGTYFGAVGQYAQARRSFWSALRLDPWVPSTYGRLAFTFLGGRLNRLGRRLKTRWQGEVARRRLQAWEGKRSAAGAPD